MSSTDSTGDLRFSPEFLEKQRRVARDAATVTAIMDEWDRLRDLGLLPSIANQLLALVELRKCVELRAYLEGTLKVQGLEAVSYGC